jgi:hypothetical protein
VILLLGIYPKECKTGYSRDTCILKFTAAEFITAKLWKQLKCPMDQEIVVYIHNGIIQPQELMT